MINKENDNRIWTVSILDWKDYGRDPWVSSFTSEKAANKFADEAIKKLTRYGVYDNMSVVIDNTPADDTLYLEWIDREYGPDNSRIYKRFEIFDTPVLFTDIPVRGHDYYNAVPYLHVYDLRHGDDDSIPLTLEKQVIVNRFGTILSPVAFIDNCQRKEISDDDWSYMSDLPDCTLKEFMEELWRKEDEDNDKSNRDS